MGTQLFDGFAAATAKEYLQNASPIPALKLGSRLRKLLLLLLLVLLLLMLLLLLLMLMLNVSVAVAAVLSFIFVLNHAMHMNYFSPSLSPPLSPPPFSSTSRSPSRSSAALPFASSVSSSVVVSAKSMLTQIRVCRIILPTVRTYFFRYRI